MDSSPCLTFVHFASKSGLTGACVNAMLLNSFIRQAINDVSFTERFAAYSSQTHWSSSEVVTRGTGACFGQDGFLRPGFSYEDLINYLYARAVEHREGGQDLQKVLTRDWLLKIAASIVPRGLEVNSDFLRTLRLHLRMTIFKKVFRPGNSAENIEGGLLEHSCQNERKFRSEDGTDLMDWERVMLGAGIEVVEKEHWHGTLVPLAGSIETMCNQVIQHSTKAYVYNERISSELFIQPKPVDSILDDFAVESQNFANSLVLAVALSSASLTFRLIGSSAFSTLSAVVSVLSIFISFDTMTNVARYKIRNEEARISFYENKLSNLKKALLGMMGHKAHSSIPEHLDPFIIEIDSLVNIFQASATYYGCRQSMKLKREWQRLKKDISNRKKIRNFQKFLLCELIVDSYHINSYLQEDLVNIYKCLEDAIYYLKPKVDPKLDKKKARSLLEQLNEFTAVLDVSLQRGSIKWGFIKRRNFVHWDIVVVFRFLYSKSCCFVGSVAGRWTPIESSSKQLLNKVKRLASKCDTTILRRETRDLEELYWATHESDMASMIFLSAFLVFAASIVFSVARLFGIQLLEQAVFWASVPSTFGAVLAIFHLLRKLCILFDLWRVLREKAASARKAEDRDNIQMVSRLTLIQLLLTFLRLNAATTASIALPFSIAENGFGNLIGTPMMLPFWIALIALVQAVLATILFFVVEYSVRYHLSPKFPVIIVESFRHEINTLYWEFRRPWNDTETKQFQERETWEYVAREFLHIYRFDTVFAADRFGAILQYIQCGMETEKRSYYDSKPGDEGFKSNPEWV